MSNQIFYISGDRKFYINENSGVLALNNIIPTINGREVLLIGDLLINTSSGTNGAGGNINTSNGGGSINTAGISANFAERIVLPSTCGKYAGAYIHAVVYDPEYYIQNLSRQEWLNIQNRLISIYLEEGVYYLQDSTVDFPWPSFTTAESSNLTNWSSNQRVLEVTVSGFTGTYISCNGIYSSRGDGYYYNNNGSGCSLQLNSNTIEGIPSSDTGSQATVATKVGANWIPSVGVTATSIVVTLDTGVPSTFTATATNNTKTGGSIITSGGGGSINTTEGYIDLGTPTTRTRIKSSFVNNLNILLPNKNGTLALTSELTQNPVYTTGDQTISGSKTFVNNLIVSGTGIFNALDFNNIDNLSLSGVDVTITNGKVTLTNPIDFNNIDTLNLSGIDVSITNGNVSLTNRPTVNGTGVLLSGQGIFKSTFTHADTNMNNDTYYFANLYALNASVNKTQRVNHIMQKCKAVFASWNTYTILAREQDSTINKCTGYFINNTTTTTGTISTQIRHTSNGTLATFTGAINPPIDINFGDQVQLALKVPSYATGMSGVINAVDVTFFY
jgi:hypothetical protein